MLWKQIINTYTVQNAKMLARLYKQTHEISIFFRQVKVDSKTFLMSVF